MSVFPSRGGVQVRGSPRIELLAVTSTATRCCCLIDFGFCHPHLKLRNPLVTPRGGLRTRASRLLIILFLRAALQVLPFLTWLTAVRRGVGLGVVGVSVAERKPPLEVVPASCAYPLSRFLPLPSLDHLSVPVLFVLRSHVSSLQLSRTAFRPPAPRVHSELRFPSTERAPTYV